MLAQDGNGPESREEGWPCGGGGMRPDEGEGREGDED